MTRHTATAAPSPELLAAQERLLALRAEFARTRPVEQAFSLLRVRDHEPPAGQAQAENLRYGKKPYSLLGVLGEDTGETGNCDSDRDRDWGGQEGSAEINLHPTLGLGMLAAKKSAAGRVWLLLRVMDHHGRGWLELTAVHHALTTSSSPLHICGARQMRNLLAQGEGIFWEVSGSRLWLRSLPRAAAALGVQRLDGRPIALPISILTQSIGKVRAHLFAAFHSGRKKANPISRATLTQISRISPRSQQNYERRAGVRKQRNFATGSRLSSASAREQAWQKGPACFPWHDHQGRHGSKTAVFLAWQLPNSYNGPHEQRPHGRRKKFNRQLADLFNKGMTGNGRPAVEWKAKRYCDHAKAAAHVAARAETAVYWPGTHRGSWYVMSPIKESK